MNTSLRAKLQYQIERGIDLLKFTPFSDLSQKIPNIWFLIAKAILLYYTIYITQDCKMMVLYEHTSSNTPPNRIALLPGVATNEKPHLGEGRVPDCFMLTHFQLSSVSIPSFCLLLLSEIKATKSFFRNFHLEWTSCFRNLLYNV